MLIVHHLQVSQSERIVWLCEELKIPYDLKIYPRSPLLSPPSLKAFHPMGAAPVIQDGDITLAESGACVEYIIQKHAQGRLSLPPSHPNYADYLYWFHFSNANLHPTIARGFLFNQIKDTLPADHSVLKTIEARQKTLLTFVNDRLGKVKWLAGEEFTAADIMSMFSLSTMRVFCPLDLGAYPNIVAWLGRCGEREAYREARRKGDLGEEFALGPETPEVFMKRLQK